MPFNEQLCWKHLSFPPKELIQEVWWMLFAMVVVDWIKCSFGPVISSRNPIEIPSGNTDSSWVKKITSQSSSSLSKVPFWLFEQPHVTAGYKWSTIPQKFRPCSFFVVWRNWSLPCETTGKKINGQIKNNLYYF